MGTKNTRVRTAPSPQDAGAEAELDAALRAEGVPVLLALHTAASAVGVHYQTLWNAVTSGELKAHKQGGRWRVLRRDLANWSLRPNSRGRQ